MVYKKQEQHLPLITPQMYRDTPDQVVDILNRLIRFYEQYRDESYEAIGKNTNTLTIANDVVNGIQTDITGIHEDITGINSNIDEIQDEIDGIVIPTVNNGKLTIQQNGTEVATFTANQSGNTTANIITSSDSSILNKVYPVGAIYMSTNATSPANLFGGTWTRIQDRFLLAAGSTYSAGSTGGEATHTLTIEEMPSHRHKQTRTPNYVQNRITIAGQYEIADVPSTQEHYTENTGGGKAHNNMPPYYTVYMWRRTA